MSQDVRQWLAEIKLLQQKLAQAKQERDEALSSAANWRSLYETEAKQRRADVNLAKQTIAALEAEKESLEKQPDYFLEGTESSREVTQVQQEVARIEGIDVLRQKLVAALLECDRLDQALKVEQAAHLETRQTLTTAIGDTIERLNQERSLYGQSSGQSLDQPVGQSTEPTIEQCGEPPMELRGVATQGKVESQD